MFLLPFCYFEPIRQTYHPLNEFLTTVLSEAGRTGLMGERCIDEVAYVFIALRTVWIRNCYQAISCKKSVQGRNQSI